MPEAWILASKERIFSSGAVWEQEAASGFGKARLKPHCVKQ